MEILEGILAIAVVGLVVWIVFGSRPESRSPSPQQQDRFTERDESDLRHTGSS